MRRKTYSIRVGLVLVALLASYSRFVAAEEVVPDDPPAAETPATVDSPRVFDTAAPERPIVDPAIVDLAIVDPAIESRPTTNPRSDDASVAAEPVTDSETTSVPGKDPEGAKGTEKSATKEKEKEKEKPKPDKDKCDEKKKEALKKAVAGAYKGVFYDNDFSYVLDPCYKGAELGDGLKRLPVGRETTIDLGGQYRFRFDEEQNFRGLGLTGLDDDFLLHRVRLFGNVQFGPRMRLFAEYLDAVITNEEFAPRAIEENRSDMLNLFWDAVLVDNDLGKMTARAGRQELLYGDERLISPLDWANTRRTFDGSRLLWRTKKYDLDAFWVRPLRPNPSRFDSPDLDQQLYGVYSTYHAENTNTVDAFYLAFDNDLTGRRFDSFGGRIYDGQGDWLSELWGDFQFGTNSDNSSHNAGAWTCGIGRNLPGSWKPALWLFYDWASGGRDLGRGEGHFQFFPLAHKYLGFMDLFGRSNIESPNVRLTIDPTEKLQILAWYYYLFLEDKRDTPYSVVMTPFFPGVAPAATSLGHEIDLLATYKLGPRATLLGGYSHFFSGAYYNTPGLPFHGDADFVYLQYQLNF